MTRALVTGATGFVGANLARRLLRDGHEVHVLLRPERDPWRLADVFDDVVVHEVDLQDTEALARVVGDLRPMWVFHLAVHGAYPGQRDYPRMVRTNVLGTMALAEAAVAAGCEAFVNTGSSSEYGRKDHAPREEEALEPNSHYAVTKVASTLFCTHLGRDRGAPVRTLRLYSVYGPYEEPSRLIPTLVVHGRRGELPPLADPAVARDFVHVDDVIEAYLAAASREDQEPGVIYNVGTGRQTALREVVDVARSHAGIAAEPSWGSMESREWDTAVWVADVRKIRDALGWTPTLDLEHGYRSFAGWLEEQPALLPIYESRTAV